MHRHPVWFLRDLGYPNWQFGKFELSNRTVKGYRLTILCKNWFRVRCAWYLTWFCFYSISPPIFLHWGLMMICLWWMSWRPLWPISRNRNWILQPTPYLHIGSFYLGDLESISGWIYNDVYIPQLGFRLKGHSQSERASLNSVICGSAEMRFIILIAPSL